MLVPILFTFSAIYCVQQAPLDTSYPEDQQGWVEEQEIRTAWTSEAASIALSSLALNALSNMVCYYPIAPHKGRWPWP